MADERYHLPIDLTLAGRAPLWHGPDMVRKALVLVACLVAGCSTALRRTAQVTEALAVGSVACDGMSTRYAIRSQRYFETNPMIGAFPSDGALAGYFGTVGGGVAAANAAAGELPDGRAGSILRVALNLAVLAVEVDSVGSNVGVGVPLCGA